MAKIERVRFVPHVVLPSEGKTFYCSSSRPAIEGLPQIFWANNKPWQEANLWAVERATSSRASLKTVSSNMNGLLNYANFLEARSVSWFHFPARKSERCLVIYRGFLVKLRSSGAISPATASEYMRNCIMFYRWVKENKLLGERISLWREFPYAFSFFDSHGFHRTIAGSTTDLGVPNRKRPGIRLEGNLLPVSPADRESILDFISTNGSRELYLMLATGFFTGMRLGSICDLKITALVQAVADPYAPGLLKLAVGPGAHPPIHTKFNVTGHVWIPKALRDELLEYTATLRRSLRQAKAKEENRDLVFLTRFGNSYGILKSNQSSAVNVEMSAIRKKANQQGIEVLRNFRFHQTRCTFGTELARLALAISSDAALVIAIVSDALLHGPNSEATTFKYIRFVQTLPVKQALADRFMAAFSGADLKVGDNGCRQ